MKKAIFLSLLIISFTCFSTTTQKQNFKGFSILKIGEFHNVSLSIDGEMSISREIKKIKSINDSFSWDFVYYNNALYIAAGEKGKVYKYDFATKEISLLTAFPEGTVYAIAIFNGKLYAGLSPLGKVFKVNLDNGKYSEFFDAKCQYIWDIKVKNNSLYIATGLPGQLIKIDSNKISTVLSKDFDKHYESMVFKKNSIYVGTYPSGSIVEVKNGKSYLVYQSKYKEVKDMVFFNNKLYAICYSGNPVSPVKTKSKPARKVQKVQSFKGAIISIDNNNVPQVLYTLRTAAPYCMSVFKKAIYIGTGHSGKILSLDKEERLSIIGEVDNGQVMKMLNLNNSLYFITSNSAEIYKMLPDYALEGEYLSDIFVANNTSNWGSFYFDYSAPTGTRMEFYVRGGNSDNPDISWGNWIKIDNGSTPDIPATKMIQFKARFISHDPALSPKFKGCEFYFREANQKPLLMAKVLSPQGVKIAKKGKSNGVITPTYTSFISNHTPPAGMLFIRDKNFISFYVIAKDPNLDTLTYSFYLVFSSGTKVELQKNKKENYITLNTLAYPEGKYRFYYTVSDRESNYPDGYTIDGYSNYFYIDNTPPTISAISFNGKTLSFTVKDNRNPVEIVEISKDGGKTWQRVYSIDGINDQSIESFNISFDKKADSVIIRAYDSVGNTSTKLAK
ncbi:conserved hypothetical protein [Thermotomaculum hydrothermale]|uniref:Uncharacterized protein n=1 Tax=Thermotomaculum hydrothermale TaxID=981385 RepID=A0A7R6PY60_9BACT|nr:hypothetical protein [Thermotomaculum hydrothermale]BBB31753.1 conserved hypothetical protein [Thermotomaculum hydrothermale]